MVRQFEAELTQEQLVVVVRLGMACQQHQMTPVSGRHMDVDHPDGGELLDDGPWSEARRQWLSEVAIAGAKLGCRDSDDDKFLETALMGEAHCLITGDRDLLEVYSFHEIPLLTPADFLALRAAR